MEDKVRTLGPDDDIRLKRSYFTFDMMEDPAKVFMTYSKDAFRKNRNQMLRERIEDESDSKLLRTAPALFLPTRTVMPKGFPSVSLILFFRVQKRVRKYINRVL